MTPPAPLTLRIPMACSPTTAAASTHRVDP